IVVTATSSTGTYPLSLHDALPISRAAPRAAADYQSRTCGRSGPPVRRALSWRSFFIRPAWCRSSAFASSVERLSGVKALLRHHRSEEHTSELQSQSNLVCRLLLEK